MNKWNLLIYRTFRPKKKKYQQKEREEEWKTKKKWKSKPKTKAMQMPKNWNCHNCQMYSDDKFVLIRWHPVVGATFAVTTLQMPL